MTTSDSHCLIGERKRVPVSVIIPCYRCSDTIEHAFQSVINQSALPEEICLIDDASRDDGRTEIALRSLKERFDRLIRTTIITLVENRGPGFARNVGWDAASQPYLAFLDADDAWHPQKMEIVYGIVANEPEIDLIGHGFFSGDARERKRIYSTKDRYVVIRKKFYSILLINPFVTPSIVLKRDIAERFNPRLRYCEDHEFLLRVSHRYHISRLDLKLVELGREPFAEGGLTAMRTRMRIGEIRMYAEALKYRRRLIVWLPGLIMLSLVKHATLLGVSFIRRGKAVRS